MVLIAINIYNKLEKDLRIEKLLGKDKMKTLITILVTFIDLLINNVSQINSISSTHYTRLACCY